MDFSKTWFSHTALSYYGQSVLQYVLLVDSFMLLYFWNVPTLCLAILVFLGFFFDRCFTNSAYMYFLN